jgi:hypothetical protein
MCKPDAFPICKQERMAPGRDSEACMGARCLHSRSHIALEYVTLRKVETLKLMQVVL